MSEGKYMAVLDTLKDEDHYTGMVIDKSNGLPVLTVRSKSETAAAVALSATLTLFERSSEIKQKFTKLREPKSDKPTILH